MTINIKVMVTDVFKTDYVIDVNEGSSLGECTLLSPVCTVICTNSDKLFWISSGSILNIRQKNIKQQQKYPFIIKLKHIFLNSVR